jgi:RNA 3'-terminal phosphate cyclase-like protein
MVFPGYFLEPVMMIAPFAKLPLHLVLTGITNDDLDPSVDILRTTTLPLLKRCGLEDNLELKVTTEHTGARPPNNAQFG